jgi:hypothetical protein
MTILSKKFLVPTFNISLSARPATHQWKTRPASRVCAHTLYHTRLIPSEAAGRHDSGDPTALLVFKISEVQPHFTYRMLCPNA